MTTLEERVAAALWRHEAERAAPNVARNRTDEAFAQEAEQVRDRWLGLAAAAIAEIEHEAPPVTEIEDEAYEERATNTGFGLVPFRHEETTAEERTRRYMGQIMAECSCDTPNACKELGLCMALNQTCAKCGGEMEAGYATEQTFTAGSPDFPGSDIVTMSAGGPGKMVPCRKCKACGWSVTV